MKLIKLVFWTGLEKSVKMKPFQRLTWWFEEEWLWDLDWRLCIISPNAIWIHTSLLYTDEGHVLLIALALFRWNHQRSMARASRCEIERIFSLSASGIFIIDESFRGWSESCVAVYRLDNARVSPKSCKVQFSLSRYRVSVILSEFSIRNLLQTAQKYSSGWDFSFYFLYMNTAGSGIKKWHVHNI